jgi:hypothetical protein
MASYTVIRDIETSVISAIRNLVCPLCGGSMLGFRCLGYCGGDWREDWERAICARSKPQRPSRKSRAKHRM